MPDFKASVRDNILENKYDEKIARPVPKGHQGQCPGCRQSYAKNDKFCRNCGTDLVLRMEEVTKLRNEQMGAWSREVQRCRDLFKADCLEECGLTGHTKANKAWEMAWDRGHAYGLESVLQHLEELVDLVL